MRTVKSVLLVAGAIGMLIPGAAVADEETTHICGRVNQADAGLLAAAGDFFALGDFFKATMITENPCVGGDCGTLRAQANTVVVKGTIDDGSIVEDASSWASTASVESFKFGGATGPDASANVVSTLLGSRTAGTNHPGFASGALGGTALTAVTLVLVESPYTEATLSLTAGVETTGSACSEFIPTLPVWGFPLLGIGMVGSAALMLRKRA